MAKRPRASAAFADTVREVKEAPVPVVETAATYRDLLAGPGRTIDAWETTYLHVLPGEDAVYGWMRRTGARPVLQALPDELRPQFIDEYTSMLREAYPQQSYGTVLPFPRVFVVAAAAHATAVG